jgi:hypothetical protein
MQTAAYAILFLIAMYLIHISPSSVTKTIDERYFHPDQDPKLRPGETEAQRQDRLDRVWKEKVKMYEDEEIGIAVAGEAWDRFFSSHYDKHHDHHHDIHHHDVPHFHD